ncbi:MAG TPA: DNA translocase FtsK 4TM domain-containing protein, partial [Stellaceae bacterium]
MAGTGGSVAKSAGMLAGGINRGARGWADMMAALKRRFYETVGFALLLAAALLVATLFSYDPRDPSLDTAVDGAPHNFLGQDGAILADLLRQALGLAAYLIPLVLAGWSLRLMLNRPLPAPLRKLALLPAVVLLAALALSVLDFGAASAPAGSGGAIGWTLQRLLVAAGLARMPLATAMTAAALLGVSLLSILGLSWRDWRDLGGGAGRGAAATARFLFRTLIPRQRAPADVGPSPRARGVVTLLRERREPRLGGGDAPDKEVPDKEVPDRGTPERGGIVRFIAQRAKPQAAGRRAEEERQPRLDLVPDAEPQLPALDLLSAPPEAKAEAVDEDALDKNARLLETVLEDYGVRGQIMHVRPGPVVTMYEFEPAPGIKASRVIGLADDIARSMSAISVRVAVVPGRSVIGIELPNRKAETVYLRELLATPAYERHPGRLALVLGKDISGEPILADLARMPHLLIAGTTGSGKSVGINTMILSILYRMPPDRCKFIMVDPKMLELSVYDGIPHLLAPVVTDPKKAVLALKWT